MKLQYPIAIEPGDETTAFGVVVPDLPGCFSAGYTLDEAVENSKEAIALWIETVSDDNGTVMAPGKMADHAKNPEFSGWTWAVVEIDEALLDDKSERVNSIMHHIFTHPEKPGYVIVPDLEKKLGAGLVSRLFKRSGIKQEKPCRDGF
jgi:Uncharacterized conserved protein